MQLQSTAKPLIRSTSDSFHSAPKLKPLAPSLAGRGIFIAGEQPTTCRLNQRASAAILARYGEPDLSDSVEIIQGNRHIAREQYVPVGGLSCPVHPYRADLFSDARPGANARFCPVLAGERHRLPPLEGAAVDTTDEWQSFHDTKQQPKGR